MEGAPADAVAVRFSAVDECWKPVPDNEADRLCITTTQIESIALQQLDLEERARICEADFDGCLRKIEVYKGNRWMRIQTYLTMFLAGAFTALAVDAAD